MVWGDVCHEEAKGEQYKGQHFPHERGIIVQDLFVTNKIRCYRVSWGGKVSFQVRDKGFDTAQYGPDRREEITAGVTWESEYGGGQVPPGVQESKQGQIVGRGKNPQWKGTFGSLRGWEKALCLGFARRTDFVAGIQIRWSLHFQVVAHA